MIEKLSGKKQEVLEEIKTPPGSEYLLDTFFDLGSTRASSGGGQINSISYSEIQAYTQLTCTELEPWEIEIIKTLDRVYINSVYDARKSDDSEEQK